jgi:hypothetical protein
MLSHRRSRSAIASDLFFFAEAACHICSSLWRRRIRPRILNRIAIEFFQNFNSALQNVSDAGLVNQRGLRFSRGGLGNDVAPAERNEAAVLARRRRPPGLGSAKRIGNQHQCQETVEETVPMSGSASSS